jgi:serine protease AprX
MTAQFGLSRFARLILILGISCLPWMSLSPATGAPAKMRVIVQAKGGQDAAAAAVRAVGGTVNRRLPIIDGVSAVVARSKTSTLRSIAGVVNVTPDAKVGFDGAAAPTKVTAKKPSSHIPDVVNATKMWAKGIKGNGVTVAVLDTGVYAAHPDLQGRVVHCVDFSHERGTDAECDDTFGHGTFMAGLIAGNGAASKKAIVGTAPQAKIVSVKVAGFDGSTDISHILAGIQWVVSHKDAYGIRVLNLSLGSDSSQDYRISPLNLAAERAWQAGIVTMVSAGNSGPNAQTMHKPGDDPYVITVGASNDEGTVSIADDRIPVFSSRGPTRANGFVKPDVVAPGVKTISLRSPGSAIDQNYGSTAVVEGQYFRGTGTSMSTAVASGVAALVIQKSPNLVPDQVKFRLMNTARPIIDTDPNAAGEGVIDANAAGTSRSTQRANQDINALSTGLGLLESDRGTVRVEVVTPLGQIDLVGEFVAQLDLLNPASLVPWVGLTYSTVGWDPLTWDLTTWVTNPWAATVWDGTQWRATVWDGTQWRGTQWRNEDWDGAAWLGTQWRYADWDGTQWRASTWQSKWYAAAWN